MKTFVLSQHAQTNVELPRGYLSGVCVCVCARVDVLMDQISCRGNSNR